MSQNIEISSPGDPLRGNFIRRAAPHFVRDDIMSFGERAAHTTKRFTKLWNAPPHFTPSHIAISSAGPFRAGAERSPGEKKYQQPALKTTLQLLTVFI